MSRPSEQNLRVLAGDIAAIQEAFGLQLVKVGVFGSVLTKPLEEANDIDLALFLETPFLPTVRGVLDVTRLQYDVDWALLNGTYIGGAKGKDHETGNKRYHIVVLDAKHPNADFMSRQGGLMEYIYT